VGIPGRVTESTSDTRLETTVVKAGKPVTAATAANPTIR